MSNTKLHLKQIIIILTVILTMAGCNQPRDFNITPTNDGTTTVATEIFAQATDAQIEKTLTATMEPLAMSVNGVTYPLAEFKNDLLRFMMVHADMEPEEAFNTLTSDLIEQMILQQAAIENGFTISADELDQRISTLAADIGGQEMLDNWISNNYYTESTFRLALERELAINYQKEILLADVPSEVEQVELYQILIYDEATAKQIFQTLADGTDYFWLAAQYHPATKGYIGWNPKGAMLPQEVEEAAYSLDISTYSEILQTEYGYHIIYINAREPHELSPENLFFLQETALKQWMELQKQNAAIEIDTTYDQ